jgi:hypothetical protein
VQELVEALETASGCIVDLLMGDDGQAHKEGRKTLRKLSAALAKVQP